MKKLKRLNIAIILMLLVFQTVLSPISVFANDTVSNDELSRVVNSEDGEPGSDESKDAIADDNAGVDAPKTPEVLTPPEKENDSEGTEGKEVTSESSEGDKEVIKDDEEKTEEIESDPTTNEGTNEEVKEDEPKEEPSDVPDRDPDEIKVNIINQDTLKIYDKAPEAIYDENGVITDYRPTGNELESNVDVNSEAFIFMRWNLPYRTEGYAAGDTFTFTLPQQMKGFDVSATPKPLSGGVGTYIIDSYGNVTFTITDDIEILMLLNTLEENGSIHGSFWVGGGFDVTNMDNSTSQELIFKWQDTIITNIPVDFKPMDVKGSKTGKAFREDKESTRNSTYIEWTVDFNKEGKHLTNVVLEDVLNNAALQVDPTSVKWSILPVNLDGTAGTPLDEKSVDPSNINADSESNFQINLGEITTPIRVTFTTIIDKSKLETGTDPSFLNKISVTANNEQVEHLTSNTIKVSFNKPIEKNFVSYSAKEKLLTWQVKYNYDQAKRGTTWFIDTIGEGHKFHKVISWEKMSVNSDGNATVVSDVKNDSNYSVESTGKNEVVFKGPDDAEAYLITYSTKLDERVTEEGKDFSNNVHISNTELGGSASAWVQQGILKKNVIGTDYKTKNITWELKINTDNQNMKNVVVTDDFDGQNLTLKLSELKNAGADKIEFKQPDGKYSDVTDAKDNPTTNSGFKLTFNELTKEKIIQYTTSYDSTKPLPNSIKGYVNKANIKADGLKEVEEQEASVKPTEYTENNGKKTGVYNKYTREITWTVDVNYNYQTITNAVLEDSFTGNQKLVKDSFEVQKLDIINDTTVRPIGEDLYNESALVLPKDGDSFSFKLKLGDLVKETDSASPNMKEAYRITYKTTLDLEGEIIDKEYSNHAKLTGDGATKEYFDREYTVKPDNGGEFLDKTGKQNGDLAKWKVVMNASRSSLIGNPTLTDELTGDQKYLPDTFKLSEEISINEGKSWNEKPLKITLNEGSDNVYSIDNEGEKIATLTINEKNFSLVFDDTINSKYVLKYSSYINEAHGELISNKAKFAGEGKQAIDSEDNAKFQVQWGASGGAAALKKQPLKILKVDSETNAPLEGAEFNLWNANGTVLLETGLVTNENGEIVTKNSYISLNYQLEEIKAPEGYQLNNPNKQKVTFKSDKDGKYSVVTVENTIDIAKSCEVTFINTDEDTDEVIEANSKYQVVKVVNEGTKIVVISEITSEKGKIITPLLPAGDYELIQIEGPEGYYSQDDPNFGKDKTIGFKVDPTKCSTTMTPIPHKKIPNTCEVIFINVNKDRESTITNPATYKVVDENGNDVVTGIISDKDGIVTVPSLPSGEYTLVQTEKPNGFEKAADQKFEVNEKTSGDCSVEQPIKIKHTPNTCEVIFVTTFDDKEIKSESTYKVVEKENPDVVVIQEVKSDENGKVTLPKLNPGDYILVQTDAPAGFEKAEDVGFTVTNKSGDECQAVPTPIPHTPNTCEVTFINKDGDQDVKASSEYKVIDENGATVVASVKSDSDGKIIVPKLPPGEYKLVQVKTPTGYLPTDEAISFTISENEDGSCTVEPIKIPVTPTNACPIFTLTIQDKYGVNRPKIEFTIKDLNKNTIATGKTNENGVATIPYTVEPGKYLVYEGDVLLGEITVIDCSALVKPSISTGGGGGGGGWTPDPEKPVDPEKPKPEPEKPVDPEKPKPELEKPVKPKPEKPDPNKPNPDPEKPVNSNKPNPGNPTTDTKNPINPGKPETNKPSVEEVIDQGKELKPYNPSTADKDTLDAHKDLLDKYNQLSKEEQAEVDKYLDIDKIKADAKEMEAQLNAQGKLPQTNGANQTALTLIGVALVLSALFLLRRRNGEVK